MNDSDILRLIRESPAKGHRALFDEYYNYVRAITLRILRNYGSEDDIDDCVIDTFTDILLNVDSGREGSLKAYIGTTAKNKAISLQRSLKRRNAGSFPLDDDTMNNIPSIENRRDRLYPRNVCGSSQNEMLACNEKAKKSYDRSSVKGDSL